MKQSQDGAVFVPVLQTRKPQRDHHHHRICMTKGKGFGAIKEIENEEISTRMMQSLERFMRSYPSVWDEASVEHLLVEIADTRYANLQNSEAEERLQTIINRVLVPVANIMGSEQGFMTSERQKIQEATMALQRVQKECQLALGDLKQEHDHSRKDLKELAKSLEEHRMAAYEAGKNLAAKEKQIQDLLQKQRNLLIRLVTGGPSEFLRWAREEIEASGMENLSKELEQAWGCPEKEQLVSDQGSDTATPEREFSKQEPMWRSALGVVGMEVLQQVTESYDSVFKSPLSIPFVIPRFWIGIAKRMTSITISTVFASPRPISTFEIEDEKKLSKLSSTWNDVQDETSPCLTTSTVTSDYVHAYLTTSTVDSDSVHA